MNPEIPAFSTLSADAVLYEENDLIAEGGPVVELDVRNAFPIGAVSAPERAPT